MSDGEGSRADRLRNRRAGRQEQAETGEPSEPAETDDPSNTSKPSKPDETDEQAEPSETDERDEAGETGETDDPSVKDEQVGTYMYLPRQQKKEIERLYNVLTAEYEYEFDREFEKNRHFYPLLIQYGLDGLEGLDASEIQTRLDEL